MVYNILQEEERKTATQLKGVIIPIKQSVSTEPEARAITEEEKKFNAFNAICQVGKNNSVFVNNLPATTQHHPVNETKT